MFTRKKTVTRSESNGVKSKRKSVSSNGVTKSTYKAKSKSGKGTIKTISSGDTAIQKRNYKKGKKTYISMTKSGIPNVANTKNISASEYKKAKKSINRGK